MVKEKRIEKSLSFMPSSGGWCWLNIFTMSQISSYLRPFREMCTIENILPRISAYLGPPALCGPEISSQQMLSCFSMSSWAVLQLRKVSSSWSMGMAVSVAVARRACRSDRRYMGCDVAGAVTILNCCESLSCSMSLPSAVSDTNDWITLCRVGTLKGSIRSNGHCRRANSTNVRCCGKSPMSFDGARSNSTDDTKNRTHGGSSVGSQWSAPSGAPSALSLLIPSMMMIIRAGECFFAAAAKKRFKLHRNSSSDSGTFISRNW